MLQVTAALYEWLTRNQIDPEKVTLVIRAKDEDTRTDIEARLLADLSEMTWKPERPPLPQKLKRIRLHGIAVSISSLDQQ